MGADVRCGVLPARPLSATDAFRAKVAHLPAETATAVRYAHTAVDLPLIDVPAGLDLPARVAWIARRVDPLLATAPG